MRSTSARSVGRMCRITSASGACDSRSARASTNTSACGRSSPARHREPASQRHTASESISSSSARTAEGEYAGVGGRTGGRGAGAEIATQTAIFTEGGCERIIRYAFDLAATRPRRKVTSVTKSNAQQYGMTLWDDVFHAVAADYPDVETEQWLVDAMAARFVLRPETLDVVVARTCSAISFRTLAARSPAASASPPAPTSIRSAASRACSNRSMVPRRISPGRASPIPIGQIGSAALMLDHLGLPDEARRIVAAIEHTTANGPTTPDLGGSARTTEVGDAIANALN